jgi:hypothetical protein
MKSFTEHLCFARGGDSAERRKLFKNFRWRLSAESRYADSFPLNSCEHANGQLQAA